MLIKKMEVEEKTEPSVDNPDENNSKKGKILTLLFPGESQPAEAKEPRRDKNKPPTKVVIRRLPPRFTKDAFIEEFSPLPAHDYFHFVRGDLNLGSHAFSRAYINFLNQDDIFSFKEKFDDCDLQDEKGRTYHAVVEFAPFQKIPKRNNMKKKLSKAGTLESDPKYLEFLQKLEESKNFMNNPSEYFHETENASSKTKVVTTPLLEFLKRKRQKKIDLRNEIRQRKREAEREKKRKEEEKRKAEREKRREEKKNSDKNRTIDEKGKKSEEKIKDKRLDDRIRVKEEKKDSKNRKNLENDFVAEEQMNSVIRNDPAILEVVVRRSEKEAKSGIKSTSKISEEDKSTKVNESDTIGRSDKKYSEFRSRVTEEKQRKSFYKRDADEFKIAKTNSGHRKGVPDEKGDNYNIGNCGEAKDTLKKIETDNNAKRHDCKTEVKETKSKFRYSEQRNRENRDREYRQKTSDRKNPKENYNYVAELKSKVKEFEDKSNVRVNNFGEEEVKRKNLDLQTGSESNTPTNSNTDIDPVCLPSRRKSLEMEREMVDIERKRSKSFHDVSSKDFCGFVVTKKIEGNEGNKDKNQNNPEKESNLADDNFKENADTDKMDEDSKKDPRAERRIRNKDRPSLEIYRPGMGKFSKQRLEQKKEDSNCTSPTGTPYSNKFNRFAYKSNNKKHSPESKNPFKKEEPSHKINESNGKSQSELRTMTFTRSASKEN